jgi:hypothetical protein
MGVFAFLLAPDSSIDPALRYSLRLKKKIPDKFLGDLFAAVVPFGKLPSLSRRSAP